MTSSFAMRRPPSATQPRNTPPILSEVPQSSQAMEGFETEEACKREDQLRARRMRRILNSLGRAGWLNIKDRIWTAAQRPPRVVSPQFNRDAIIDLASRIEIGIVSGFAPLTLASSLRMRTIRLSFSRAILDAFETYSDNDLRTVTVIYQGWSYSSAELEQVTAAKLKAQFRQHLNRADVLKVEGPLFAVLHGEFDPISGRYQLHYHCLTTALKAAAMKSGLTAKKIKGYAETATRAPAVRRSRIGDRVKQLTYLVKSYWPSRPILQIDGETVRVRKTRRIPEPCATQVLLWLDRQSFADLIVSHNCWSRRIGGTEAMKRLYLIGAGVG